MAVFDWTTCTIDMTNRRGGLADATLADMASLPSDEQATVSFVHEYSHFLQAMGSYGAFSMMAELVEIATIGSLCLTGVVTSDSAVVHGYHPVIKTLANAAPHAGAAVLIRPRLDSLLDEARAVLLPQVGSSPQQATMWDLASAVVTSGSFTDSFDGVVTPSGFRPFNVAFLAENMARQVDRWVACNQGFSSQPGPSRRKSVTSTTDLGHCFRSRVTRTMLLRRRLTGFLSSFVRSRWRRPSQIEQPRYSWNVWHEPRAAVDCPRPWRWS